MWLQQLQAQGLRSFSECELSFSPGINVIYGDNGAGKTSILEGISVLSSGKSFRTSKVSNIITNGQAELVLFGEVSNLEQIIHLGAQIGPGLKELRLNREKVNKWSELAKNLPVLELHPESYLLITGGPVERRKFLNWGMFHVEQNYIAIWKSYYRALRHRNALLKSERSFNSSELTGWEKLIAEEARKIDGMRDNYINKLNQILNDKYLSYVLSGTGAVKYLNENYRNEDLCQLLLENRDNDIKRGYTSIGPHRVDISFVYEDFNVAKHLSRGQTKLFGAAVMSSQVDILKSSGLDALILVDDLDAELDETSSKKMFELLQENNVQTFVSSLTKPPWINSEDKESAVFHVKHGEVEKMVE